MAQHASEKRSVRKRTKPSEEISTVEDLVRQLVNRAGPVANDTPRLGQPEHIRTVVLDTVVDGVHYALVREDDTPAPVREAPLLSPRELEIACLIAKGHPNKTIAAVLEISCWTVCTYLRRMFMKVGVTSRAALVARLHDLYVMRDGAPALEPTRFGR